MTDRPGSFECSPRVRLLEVGEDTALLSERDGVYQVLQLNETASRIWRALDEGRTRAQTQQLLEALGAAPSQAREFVETQIDQWIELGYVAPREIIAALAEPPSKTLCLAHDEMVVELRLFGTCGQSDIETAFASLASEETKTGKLIISLVGEGANDHLFVNDQALGRGPRRSSAPRIKAALLDEYLGLAREGFCTHAAVVSFEGRRVLLTGPPGAGKSTLTLALAGEGFAYGGDDTARVAGDGRIKGLPFAAAVKEGAWPLIERWHGEIRTLTTHERLDGQLARYFAPLIKDKQGYQELFAALRLERTPRARAHIVPIAPLEVLCALLESAYTEHAGAATGPTCAALARVLSNAVCARLIYDDLSDAVALIKALVAGSKRPP